ncbi:MAG: hypothetical protein COS92_04930 [Desulfobacterales bacterium CG07_land_8_20_14_0_80_52_14]|nr:MAG: hypothetical protein COX20_07710 [Desulfobacterales bacterium CG23_combo_of_CG06-09_8_20_14_all_52_9]PIU49763.1 MAG: hypothetical protein COS92_04930 [Desulfobacterales bacterium CG07_land_8_20_14_0_80_52_14]
MTDRKGARPFCFGKLECVFPMGSQGFRETPESCFPCIFRVECLRSAMDQVEGLTVREETVDRAYSCGVIGFWARWSKKKSLRQEMEKRHREKKSKS